MPGHTTKGFFSYPDIVIIYDEPEYHDAFRDVVINPSAIVEVLSPGTEAVDGGEKFKRLRKHNPTLHDYVLVAQDQPLVEHSPSSSISGLRTTFRIRIGGLPST